MRKITHIIVHTSASYNKTKGVLDPSAADIDAMHRTKGWAGIGYHYVVRRSGQMELGRPVREAGAHVLGFNATTIGICCSGHGDHAPLTAEQSKTLVRLIADLAEKYGLAATILLNPNRVLGHAEVGKWRKALAKFVGHDVPDPHKSCPGHLVDMKDIRCMVSVELEFRRQTRASRTR